MILGVVLCIADCYMVASYDWKANARAVRAEDLDHFYWRMRLVRGLGMAISDALFTVLLWASSTNRVFVIPQTATERTEAALQQLEGIRGRLGAIGIVRNVVARDEGFRKKGDVYWRREGQMMSEVMDEREVVDGIQGALGSGRIDVTLVEEEARKYAEGIIVGPESAQQR